MVIKQSTVQKLSISELERLDPINVFFEDYGPQRGKVTVEVCGDSWSYFWGAMGEGYTIKSFFLKADTDYLVRKLKIGIQSTIDDDSYDALVLAAKREVISDRRNNNFDKATARDKWDYISQISDYGKEANSDVLYEIFGPDWYSCLPQIPNPKYQYICRIVDTIKEALRKTSDSV